MLNIKHLSNHHTWKGPNRTPEKEVDAEEIMRTKKQKKDNPKNQHLGVASWSNAPRHQHLNTQRIDISLINRPSKIQPIHNPFIELLGIKDNPI